MRRMIPALAILAAVWTGAPSSVRAGEDDNRHAKVLAPYVDDMTFMVAHVDLSSVKLEGIARALQQLGMEKKEVAQAMEAAAQWRDAFLKAGGKELYFLMNFADPFGDFLCLAPVGPDADAAGVGKLLETIPSFKVQVEKGLIVASTRQGLDNLKTFKPRALPALAKAFAAFEKSPHQVILVPPPILNKANLELMPTLPKEIGGGATSKLIDGVAWAGIGWDIGDEISGHIVIQSQDAKAARVFAQVLSDILTTVAKRKDVQELLPTIDKLVPLLTPKVEGDRLNLNFDAKDLYPVVTPLLAKVKNQASDEVSLNNMKQLGLAMHNYYGQYETLPARASFDKQGKALLSWRVQMLPYVEQNNLYKKFHLDEPWDSEHNKKLIAEMPEIFRSGKLARKDGKTAYLVPVGAKSIFEGKKGMTFKNITDGTSNTILLVEVDESRAVIWTQPEDHEIDAKDPSAGLFRKGGDTANVLFADGSARRLNRKVTPESWRALFTANGGEVIKLP